MRRKRRYIGRAVLGARARTETTKQLTREQLRIGRLLYPPVDVARPRTRGDCKGGERPCPWVGCKWSLYLDVNEETGSVRLNFPDREPWEMAESCALDVADRGGATLEEVGAATNVVRERIRQVEVKGLLRLRRPAQRHVTGNDPAEALGLMNHDKRGPWDD